MKRLLSFVLTSLAAGASLFAATIEPTGQLPPSNAVYTLPDTCMSPVCLANITISGFTILSDTFSGGNEFVDTTAALHANVLRDVAGSPGPAIGPVTMTGPVDFEFFMRTDSNETGTFDATITSLDLSGDFSGLTGPHHIEAILNPGMPASGTSVVAGGANGEPFQISSFFDVFTELSIDGGTFVPGPERRLDLASAPEPATFGFGLAGLIACAAFQRFRRRGAAAELRA